MWLAYILTLYLLSISVFFYANGKRRIAGTSDVVYRTRSDKAYLLFAITPLLLMACLRGESVGSDTPQYVSYFDNIKDAVGNEGLGAILTTRLEPGFIFFIKILTLFFDSAQSLLIITAVFFYFSFVRFIVKYSKLPWLSVIMFFSLHFNGSMNVIRQYVAMGILFYAFEYLLKKKTIRFVILVIAATFSHYTSIIFLIAYYFRNKNVKTVTIKMFFCLLPIAAVLSFLFLSVVLNIFHSFGLYDYYNEDNKHISGGVKIATFVELVFTVIVAIISCRAWGIFKNKTSINTDPINRLLFWFSIISVGIMAISFPFSLLDRLATFFTIFNCVLLPNSVYEISKRKRITSLSVFLCILYSSYYIVVNTFRPDWTSIYPYHFY